MIYAGMRDHQKAQDYFKTALLLYEESGNSEGIVKSLLNLTFSQVATNHLDEGLENARKALEINKKNGNFILDGTAYNVISKIYTKKKSYDKAFDNELKAYEIFVSNNYSLGQTYTLTALADLSFEVKDFQKAEMYYLQALELANQSSFLSEMKDIYSGMAQLYEHNNNYQKAYENQKKLAAVNDSLFKLGTSKQVLEMSAKYDNQQRDEELKKFKYQKSLGVIMIVVILTFLIILLFLLSNKNKTLKALKFQQNQNVTILDTLQKQKNEIQKQSQKMKDANLELEKLSLVARKTDNTILIADVDGDVEWVNESFIKVFNYTEKDLNFINYEDKILAEIVRVLHEGIHNCKETNKPNTFSFNFRDRYKNKHWYQTSISPIFNTVGEITKFIVIGSDITPIKLAEIEIKIQHTEIESQRDQIAKQKDEIMSSILYAERIQKAVLPPNTFFQSVFEESFIFYLPRDIISGDFFWAADKRDKKIIAVADCTGHGVPGAFMSMLGIVLLNEIVNKHQDLVFSFNLGANQILNLLRIKLKKSLHQTGLSGEANDGLDIALCIIEKSKMELTYATANLPIYIANNNQVTVLKGDKMPIGVYTENDKDFAKFTHKINEGDILYLATDGYADQFGGPTDKKFLVKNFREMLASVCELPMEKQHEIVSDIFEGWKGNIEQTDDVTVIGIKL
jgi:PAS domain S-box-containing protein